MTICSAQINTDDVATEQAEIQQWVGLIKKAQEYQFNAADFGSELATRQMEVVSLLDEYMLIIEDAEYRSYDGVDVSEDLKLAQSKLNRLGQLKSLYKAYYDYKESENSAILPLAIQTVLEEEPQLRIKLPALEAMKRSFHDSTEDIPRSRGSMVKVSFADGDYFYFLNDRLYQLGGDDPSDSRSPQRNYNNATR